MGCWRFLDVSLISEPRDPLNGVDWLGLFPMVLRFGLTGVRGNSLKASAFLLLLLDLPLGTYRLGVPTGVLVSFTLLG